MDAEVNGGGNVEVSPWLKSMPVAPEYHPSLVEFQDPIAYIFKIEKDASKYGICKIVPPVSAAPRKTVVANFNKSLLARSTDPESGPTFTTRQQQIGFCPRKHRPVQKPVWQSGERYTLAEFESKAKNFERSYLKKYAKRGFSALEMETLYWNAMVDKPFSVEYANDMPGSAFVAHKSGGRKSESSMTVGDTEWNMRRVSRGNLSLLRLMKEEIPGVTSPMVYVAMMFSWFAWHVEDHDLHSMNYLHMGAGKTWYGVPREAAVAFEEVIREHGYGGEINPLVTFSMLGAKTTVMSPEVLLSAGVPCCRLVQNAGEFVVTFPRAYHSGFSHGFNCGEAANIATPEWLRVAKEAAIRRAAINCPPMVSHFQLLYDLALSLCSRVPKNIATEPRSSRLKDRKKGEGDMLIKELFFQDMMQNNDMLHTLGKGSSIVLLPKNSLSRSVCSNKPAVFQSTVESRLFPSLCSLDLELKAKNYNARGEFMVDSKQSMKQARGYAMHTRAFSSPLCNSSFVPSVVPQAEQMESESKKVSQCEQGLFSCVTCGILCFACVAIVQPTEAAAQYIRSADSSLFNCSGVSDNDHNHIRDANAPHTYLRSELVLSKTQNELVDVPVSADQLRSADDESLGMVSNSKALKEPSSLGLLALAYSISSDSEEDEAEADIPVEGCKTSKVDDRPENGHACDRTDSVIKCTKEISLQVSDSDFKFRLSTATCQDGEPQYINYSDELRTNTCKVIESNSLTRTFRHQIKSRHDTSNSLTRKTEATISTGSTQLEDTSTTMLFSSRSNEDSSRLHVFCLQHAMQVEKWLSQVGGARVFLVCHPDYLELHCQAKKVAEEFGSDRVWNEIPFRAATEKDEEIIRLALQSENAIHGNGDWAVKLGINLFYSANLSRSPLYCKQMHYNFVVYSAFGRSLPYDSSANKAELEKNGRQKKIVVAGKWCGKVWMSSQAHPLLVNKDLREQVQELEIAKRTDLKCERQSEVGQVASTMHRTGRKRKNNNARVVKEKYVEDEKMDDGPSLVFSLTNCHTKQIKRKRGSRRFKKETHLSENSSDGSSQDSDSCKKIKHLKRETKKNTTSEPECGNEPSEEFPNCWKQIKSKHGARPMRKDIPEPIRNQQRSKKQPNSLVKDDDLEGGPSTRLRKRTKKPCKDLGPKSAKAKPVVPTKQQKNDVKSKKVPGVKNCNKLKIRDEEASEYECDMEGCTMSFGSKQELTLHKRNVCPVKGCGKKFFSHKYLVQHRRVHMDDRPLKCPWKGCKMTFKWAWARTEHIRVHTGARPYVCTEDGCGQTFRFVSDYSRHKRKTGHSPKKARG